MGDRRFIRRRWWVCSCTGSAEGSYASRRLQAACRQDVAFMYLMGGARPDFHTISTFRRRFQVELTALHTPDGFQQSYNAQAAVDADSQVIVACEVSAAAPDVQRLEPMLKRITDLNGQAPWELSADAGYASEANCHVFFTDLPRLRR